MADRREGLAVVVALMGVDAEAINSRNWEPIDWMSSEKPILEIGCILVLKSNGSRFKLIQIDDGWLLESCRKSSRSISRETVRVFSFELARDYGLFPGQRELLMARHRQNGKDCRGAFAG